MAAPTLDARNWTLACNVCSQPAGHGLVLVPVQINEQRVVCASCASYCARKVGKFGDGCDAWFVVERPSLTEEILAQARAYADAVNAETDRALRISNMYGALASASIFSMNTLAAETKPGPKSDPAEPEPSVSVRPEPKPIAPAASEAPVDRERRHHEIARGAADADRYNTDGRVTKAVLDGGRAYVAAYIAARKQLTESAY